MLNTVKIRSLFFLLITFLLVQHIPSKAQSQSTTNTAKPWTYWWWMGGTVTESDITWQLEHFAKAGLGGVHIIPIYGVKGLEKQAISFLSPRWMEVLGIPYERASG